MKSISKIVCFLMALLFSVISFAACNGKEPADETTATTSVEITEEQGLKFEDFGNQKGYPKDFSMLVRASRYRYLYATVKDSDTVAKAAYERNQKIEQNFNVDFSIKEVSDNAAAWNTVLTGSSGEYDLGCFDYLYRVEEMGLLENLLDMEEINTKDNWWYQGWNDVNTVNGQMYSIAGDTSNEMIENMGVIFFNKNMAAGHGLSLYDEVNNGTWTLEKMKTISVDVSENMFDNDKSNDVYGTMFDLHSVRMANACFGLQIVKKTENDFYELVEDTTINGRNWDVIEDFCDFVKNSNSVQYSSDTCRARETTTFTSGKSLFFASALLVGERMRSANMEFTYHAALCDVEKEGQRIKAASFATKSGIFRFSAETFIDATGDADLTALAQVPTVLGRPGDHLCQPMTLCFRMGNIDKEKFFAAKPLIQELYRKAQAEGKIKNPREDVLMFNYPTEGVVHFNTTRVIKRNPTDPFDVTKAEMEGRRQVMEIIEFLKENRIPGFERAELLMTGPSIGARESRMLVGEYVLTGEDLVNCVLFSDSVAAGNYDLDIHSPDGAGTSHHYFDRHTWYTIPYRCLIPKKEDATNLLVAGRCISATHEAQASVRIMPICATTGEAVGIAAALSVKTGKSVQDIDVGELQKRLRDSGAFLGI